MKQVKSQQIQRNQMPLRWLFGGLALVTLYFQTNIVDPFNSPKSWLLLIIASWLTGYIWNSRNIISQLPPIKILCILGGGFVIGLLIATLFSDNIYISIFGEAMRKNGFLPYLALVIIMVSAAFYVRLSNINILFQVTYFVGGMSGIYGLMQSTGNDFILWNNPHNPVITTLGNPNFAAALMAVMGILIFSVLFIRSYKLKYKIVGAIICFLLLLVIYRSNARQGLLSYAIGIGVFLIIFLWYKNKWLGLSSSVLGLIVATLAVLGMLQKGPFEKFLYKASVTIRGYYWNAGIEMFQNYPLTGVGMDRYGAFFKQYREQKYSLSYGFEITSTNAHNTFIQFFATGGLVLGLAYLFLNFYVLKRALIGLKDNNQDNRLIIAGVFSSWVAYQAQSLISIDNIGISIWGWVLGGTIVGLSVSTQPGASTTSQPTRVLQKNNPSRSLISGSTTLFMIVLVTILYRGEVNANRAMISFDLQNEQARETLRVYNNDAIKTPLLDPTYKLNAAMNLIGGGFIDEGLVVAEQISQDDPRNLDALNSIATVNEQINKLSIAITTREKISVLDPWNAANYLQQGRNYKTQGDLVKSSKMLEKILSFASNHPISAQAKIELTP
jgi:O-antigen ligase